MEDLKELKKRKDAQRREAIEKRRALTVQQREEKSERICGYLLSLPEIRQAKTVFSYRATWDEVNLDSFHRWAVQENKKVAYPVFLPHGIMKAAVPRDNDAWEKGAYGIWSPQAERSDILMPGDIDVIVVPCVAYDREGGRCGHGAGYYDRYLPLCRKDMLPVLVAFEAQKTERVAAGDMDYPMKAIVTESGILHSLCSILR